MNIPAQDHLHHQGHGVHVDAAHQDRHEGERYPGQHPARFAIAQLQVARHRVRSANVVKRHHHDGQDQDGGNRSDQVRVGRDHAELVGGGRPPHHFQGTQVRRDEAQARNPSRHAAASHEETLARAGVFLQVEPQTQDHQEVNDDDEEIDAAEQQQTRRRSLQYQCRDVHRKAARQRGAPGPVAALRNLAALLPVTGASWGLRIHQCALRAETSLL